MTFPLTALEKCSDYMSRILPALFQFPACDYSFARDTKNG